MKVFISWSGQQSQELGEVLRDWLPAVLQLVTPYFTPSDIEKGTRWSTHIAQELSASKVGILCVTRDNLHSDWILFEAGALSKSLDKTHVCPILFGITNTDLAGPLKQFQTTEFTKSDMQRLLGVINGRIGDNKLPQKTLDTVFEKWWPDLKDKTDRILAHAAEPEQPIRSDRELLEEILQLSRIASRSPMRSRLSLVALQELLSYYIALHDRQVERTGDYQDTLNYLQKMHKPIGHITRRYRGTDEKLDDLIAGLESLSYTAPEEKGLDNDDIPF